MLANITTVFKNFKYLLAEKKLLKQNSEVSVEKNEKFITKVGLVTTAEAFETVKPLLKLQQELKIAKGDFKVLVCTAKPAAVEDERAIFFAPSEIKAGGNIENEAVQDFFKLKFNVFIAFSGNENRLKNLVFKCAKSVIKIDHKRESQEADLMIETADVHAYQQEILKYLKKLKQIR
ncbi:hypothetical protein ZPR_3249 [Zunongwangia profunda SM-A87]|uniref:Uncharacterized protein n=1 Tax=Zunongwangia profunda (strain DSM 18752 / CCTCC AB 206139 / SM-A87) TaxID=655815 RepID=D5BIF2_ZUNPS|nr:hypothetical protein ZPR_3249 [Zunongwangia profunda SM-A87]